MNEMTARKLSRDLDGKDDAQRIESLVRLVLDLTMEVEALRAALAGEGSYREAYAKTLLLAHDAAGISSGNEKLLARFYSKLEPGFRAAGMLERLGYDAAAIAELEEEVERMEDRT